MKLFAVPLLLLFSIISIISVAQTATNFSCNDCSGKSYDLYKHLDSGKVVIICWVMPCATCVLPTKTTYNVVQSYNSTHPGKLQMIICDDFANSSCNTIESWVAANVFTNTLKFSDKSINMSHYGTFGMPKVVVVAGTDRKVYFNQNDIINHTKLQEAINLALSETSSIDNKKTNEEINIYPNPAQNSFTINHSEKQILKIRIFSVDGVLYEELTPESYNIVNSKIIINTEKYKSGLYIVSVSGKEREKTYKLVIN